MLRRIAKQTANWLDHNPNYSPYIPLSIAIIALLTLLLAICGIVDLTKIFVGTTAVISWFLFNRVATPYHKPNTTTTEEEKTDTNDQKPI